MGKADSLGRRSDWEKEGEKDNEKRILLKPKWLEVRMGEIIVEGVNILEKIRNVRAHSERHQSHSSIVKLES